MRPWFITAIMSASEAASSWSCVTRTVVVPSRSCSWRSSRRNCPRSVASRLDSGSSSNSTGGSCTSARASATRCCWPPESCAGRRSSSPGSPTMRAIRSTLSSARRVPLRLAQRVGDVVAHRHVRPQRVMLEHHAEAAPLRRNENSAGDVDHHPVADRDPSAHRDAPSRRCSATAWSCRIRSGRAGR